MASPGSRSGSDTPRIAYWDNARFVAMALVVVGHTITNFDQASTVAAAYVVIYAFHMPLFAFISGHFSSARPVTRDSAFATFRQLVAPYLVFSVAWFLLRLLVEGRARLDFGSPYVHLWFLVALVAWRVVLPYLAALRFPVLVSLGIAVGAGYLNSVGSTFDTGKIFGMLPFFVLGWAARQRGWTSSEGFRRMTSLRSRVVAVVVLSGSLLATYVNIEDASRFNIRQLVRMTVNYADAGLPQWWAGLVRLGLLALAVVLALCVMSLVPQRRSRMTTWGSRTMYVYMLHLFPLYLVGQLTEMWDWFDSLPRFALATLLALAWTVALSSRVVARVFRPVIEPRLPWLRASEEAAERVGRYAASRGSGARTGRCEGPEEVMRCR